MVDQHADFAPGWSMRFNDSSMGPSTRDMIRPIQGCLSRYQLVEVDCNTESNLMNVAFLYCPESDFNMSLRHVIHPFDITFKSTRTNNEFGREVMGIKQIIQLPNVKAREKWDPVPYQRYEGWGGRK